MSRFAGLPTALGLRSEDPETKTGKVFRWIRLGIVIVACLTTLQSALLVAGAWRNDQQIEHNMGVAQFVTPDRVTYRPALGVLYPSELVDGMRIYVEYDRGNPDLVRVQDRNAALAIIPAGSIALLGWLVAGGLLIGAKLVERRYFSAFSAPKEHSW